MARVPEYEGRDILPRKSSGGVRLPGRAQPSSFGAVAGLDDVGSALTTFAKSRDELELFRDELAADEAVRAADDAFRVLWTGTDDKVGFGGSRGLDAYDGHASFENQVDTVFTGALDGLNSRQTKLARARLDTLRSSALSQGANHAVSQLAVARVANADAGVENAVYGGYKEFALGNVDYALSAVSEAVDNLAVVRGLTPEQHAQAEREAHAAVVHQGLQQVEADEGGLAAYRAWRGTREYLPPESYSAFQESFAEQANIELLNQVVSEVATMSAQDDDDGVDLLKFFKERYTSLATEEGIPDDLIATSLQGGSRGGGKTSNILSHIQEGLEVARQAEGFGVLADFIGRGGSRNMIMRDADSLLLYNSLTSEQRAFLVQYENEISRASDEARNQDNFRYFQARVSEGVPVATLLRDPENAERFRDLSSSDQSVIRGIGKAVTEEATTAKEAHTNRVATTLLNLHLNPAARKLFRGAVQRATPEELKRFNKLNDIYESALTVTTPDNIARSLHLTYEKDPNVFVALLSDENILSQMSAGDLKYFMGRLHSINNARAGDFVTLPKDDIIDSVISLLPRKSVNGFSPRLKGRDNAMFWRTGIADAYNHFVALYQVANPGQNVSENLGVRRVLVQLVATAIQMGHIPYNKREYVPVDYEGLEKLFNTGRKDESSG